MSDLKQFENKEWQDAPNNMPLYAQPVWAAGYNTCLEQTNAKELLRQRDVLLNALNSIYRSAIVLDSEVPEGMVKSAIYRLRMDVADAIKEAAISKATEKPQP